jgi:mercuric ion transport protein
VLAALLGSLCCTGPVAFAALGAGAGLAGLAGLASTFEPLRPLFGLMMVGMFALGFSTVYGRQRSQRRRSQHGAAEPSGGECEPGRACPVPRSLRRDKALLWAAAVLALVLWTFPTWSRLFV